LSKKTADILEKETPLMKQYNQIKAKHPQALLLFRVGDFYETFGEDAIKTSKILGIVLTKRRNGSSQIELAGFPHHSMENYLPKLVRAGQRVAICDQLEDPKMTKTIVKRGVTELVTPGIAFNDQVLDQKRNNFLCAIHLADKIHGVSFLDISTGEFLVAEGSIDYIDKLIQGFEPSEIVYQKSRNGDFKKYFGEKYYSYKLEDWVFAQDFAVESLTNHFGTKNLKGFGVEELSKGTIAAGVILYYLSETQHNKIGHITQLSRIEEDNYVWLDRFTVRNLELVHSFNDNGVTLLDIIDHSTTPMGGRMIKRWTVLPLKDLKPIEERLDAVQFFIQDSETTYRLTEHLKDIGDLERLISKVAVLRVHPKEVKKLETTLRQIQPIQELLKKSKVSSLQKITDQLNPCQQLIDLIDKTLVEEPATQIGKGNVIASGFHAELDELREISYSGKDYLENLQIRESNRTGIPSLKVSFNNVFGYYLEVTHTHKDKVPADWIRKQTLVNAERYITEELKEYETKILGAEDKIHAIEARLFQELVLSMADYIQLIQHNAFLIAKLDCLLSFSFVSSQNSYVRPSMNESFAIDY
jgi:DNA mismatch repair protein MutS